MISSNLELGIFGTNATFQNRDPDCTKKMENILFISEIGNSEEWKCRGKFYTNNSEDFEFMTERKLTLLSNSEYKFL